MVHTVLVTGSSGFLGRAVVSRLKSLGHTVVGIDPADSADAGFLHIQGGLSDIGPLSEVLTSHKITHVIHAGGVSGAMLYADHPWRVLEINVAESLALLKAALETGVKVFAYCSSVSAMGDFYEPAPIGDDHPMQPVNTYGCSKAAVEMVLRGLWRRTELDICSLRLTAIYGPGRRTSLVVDEIVAAACEGRPACPAATTDWPYIFIDDAADAIVAACFSKTRRQLGYFIAYPEQVALTDFAAAAAAAGRPVHLQIDDRYPPAARSALDVDAGIRDFGFNPKVDHREGIRRMIAARTALGTCN